MGDLPWGKCEDFSVLPSANLIGMKISFITIINLCNHVHYKISFILFMNI